MASLRTLLSKIFATSRARKSLTVRYMFPIVTGFAVLLGAQLLPSVESSYIRLAIDKQAVQTDERFSLDVFAYAHVPVNAIDVTLNFDSKKVEVLEVDRGQSVLTIWTEDPIITANSVILRGGTFRKGFLGEHKIATIDLKAKGTGSSKFSATDVMLLAGDGQGSPVTTLDNEGKSNVSLYVYDENTDPDDIKVNVKVNIISDLDGDGKVTLRDISAFMADWAKKSRLHDFNGDGKMTFKDFSIILANFFFQ